jgi:hypothetical protein
MPPCATPKIDSTRSSAQQKVFRLRQQQVDSRKPVLFPLQACQKEAPQRLD